jgi:hypothetical protein
LISKAVSAVAPVLVQIPDQTHQSDMDLNAAIFTSLAYDAGVDFHNTKVARDGFLG